MGRAVVRRAGDDPGGEIGMGDGVVAAMAVAPAIGQVFEDGGQ
jgi:hypothetical protein